MIKRIVKMTFRAGEIDAFKSIFETNWKHISGFPGCTHVELLQDQADGRVFFTYSLWESEQALESYRTSELFGRVWPATKQLFAERPQAWTVRQLTFA